MAVKEVNKEMREGRDRERRGERCRFGDCVVFNELHWRMGSIVIRII